MGAWIGDSYDPETDERHVGRVMKKTSLKNMADWIIAGGASVVLYVVPVVSQTLQNGIVTAKYFTLLACMVPFVVAVAFYLLLRGGEVRFRMTWIDGAVLCGAAYYGLNVYGIGNADPMRLILVSTLVLWYGGLRVLFTSERIFRILRLLFLSMAGYEALLGIAQCYGGIPSHHALYAATGSFYNPGPFGGFLSTFAPVALYGLLDRKNQRPVERWVAAAVFFLILVVLPVTMSRTAWAAALVGCAVVLAFHYVEPLKQWIARHRMACLAAGVSIGVFVLLGGWAAWHLKRDSADGRLLIWKNTAGIIGRYPLTGCGFGYFGGAYGHQQADRFAGSDCSEREVFVAGTPENAFNEYLQITAEGGAVGGLLFVVAAGAGVWGLWRRQATGGLCFGAVGLLIFACASYPFSLMEFVLVGLFFMAAAAPAARGATIPDCAVRLLWIVAALPLACFFWFRERPRAEAYREWRTDRLMYDMKLYEQVVHSAQSQYAFLKFEPRFLYEYAHALHFTGEYERSNALLLEGAAQSADPMFWNVMGNNYKALGDAGRAERCYRRAYWTVPNRLYPLYLLARLYRDTGQGDKLCSICDRLLNFREKVVSPATEEIKREVASWRRECDSDSADANKRFYPKR